MKHYIDSDDNIFAFESDGSQDHLITADMKPITEVEIAKRNKPTAEQLAAQVRGERDRLLLETDYLVMPDYPSKPAGIESYRQALRDVTEQAGFPEAVEWPIKP